MNSFCTSWYLDLHVGGLTLAASLFFIAFSCSVIEWARYFSALLFTLTTGSGKNKVCFLSMFLVASWRETTRVKGEENKKVRAAVAVLLADWGNMCTQHNLFRQHRSSHCFVWLIAGGGLYLHKPWGTFFFLLVLPFLSHYWFVILLMHHTTQMR